ncbi:protein DETOXIFICATION 12-like isoform X3 [Cucumis melo var. makuwa]|uniref:Protein DETOXIFICATION 12-like isoform X3 n=1 Tax=Cucumis melo var. makuwa TaxID=1194695 RepID=A0A5A7T8S2_CUCMM|nr:protein DETOXIFICATION 12-like isoform X3 [Cucumis melo var. makuwa]
MGEKWRNYTKEVKKVIFLGAPIITALLLQYLLQVITLILIGHLDDELLLSGVSIAISFVRVTGFSLLVISSSPFPSPFSLLSLSSFLLTFTM